MKTPWTDQVNRDAPLPEYPRPQLRRERWLNLNGRWQYAITTASVEPGSYDGEIIVPFSPETELSGVGRTLRAGEYLWYRRELTLPEELHGAHVLLHFGAVDQECELWINGEFIRKHTGGYLPFEAEITEFAESEKLSIVLRVTDDTDGGSQNTRGKQKTRRGGIWYTPQSGIWQTVWLEAVPEQYIRSVTITPDIDRSVVVVSAETNGGEAIAEFAGERYRLPARIPVPNAELWSPEHPKLYDICFTCGEDRVESYFAMRKFSVARDEMGNPRLFLNNAPYFQNGVLDQGYWPDGLYTAPCDEAMIFDITTAKSMGFNMLRKHIKIEPLRWYYHCDRLGMLVWQDMPCGGGHYDPAVVTAPLLTGISLKDNAYRLFGRENAEGRAQFERELTEMVKLLYNCPCISLWVIFNEGWGQFDAKRMFDHVRTLDKTRPVDHASGWHDQGVGQVVSRHIYFTKPKYKPDKLGRVVLLSEFGGYVLREGSHSMSKRSFGYRVFETPGHLELALDELYQEDIAEARRRGLAAAVYTQLTDVEDELNGLITYDRIVVKVHPLRLLSIIKVENGGC